MTNSILTIEQAIKLAEREVLSVLEDMRVSPTAANAIARAYLFSDESAAVEALRELKRCEESPND